ncbi:hypothetical protein, partial [Escherichia coli]|uniref:hypothetical protein n=1 Tax=Escherichia coli TaxID=562 RepID=UPI001BB2775F
MAGVLPATLRAVASPRSKPPPAGLSSSGERLPTKHTKTEKPSTSPSYTTESADKKRSEEIESERTKKKKKKKKKKK